MLREQDDLRLTNTECNILGVNPRGFSVEKRDDYPVFDRVQNIQRVVLGYISSNGCKINNSKSRYLGGLWHICNKNNWHTDGVFQQIHDTTAEVISSIQAFETHNELVWLGYREVEVNRLPVFSYKKKELYKKVGQNSMPDCFQSAAAISYYDQYLAEAVGKLGLESLDLNSEPKDLWRLLNHLHTENTQYMLFLSLKEKATRTPESVSKELALIRSKLSGANPPLNEEQYKELVNIVNASDQYVNERTTAASWS
jgi:hypothetical protein